MRNRLSLAAQLTARSQLGIQVFMATLLLTAPTLLSAFGGPDRTGPPPRTQTPGLSITVPFKLYRGYAIVVEGTLNGVGPMRFLIDTGTNPTIVDMRTAQALGMHGELVGLALFDRKLPVEKTVLSQLDLGPIRKQALPVVISDLKFLEKDVVGHVDAILGLAVLGDRNFTLDYKQKELVFGAVENKRAVPFASDPPFVTVQVEFGGQPLSLLVDTGTSGLVLFQSRIRGKLEQVRTNDYSHAKHIGGQFGYETVILPESRFGKADMGPVAAFVVQDKAEDKRQFDGLMGIPFLHPRRLSFDFQKHTLSWSGSW